MAELRYDGRVAVITGAGRGLGRAYALLLASRGAKVVVNDTGGSIEGEGVQIGPAQEVVDEIRAAGGEAIANTDSVGTAEGGDALIKFAIDSFGRIDILIANAGISHKAPLTEMTQEQYDAVLDVHLHGGFHVVRPAFPHMKEAGYGRIVLTSSCAGLYGDQRIAGYCTSKAGVIGLANTIALEGADSNIKCNLILPGALTRLARGRDTTGFPPMTSEMVAPVVAWLCHESCSITAEMLISFAGRVAKAYVSETVGIYRDNWTIEDVGEQLDVIRDTQNSWTLPAFPSGFHDHMRLSMDMAREGGAGS